MTTTQSTGDAYGEEILERYGYRQEFERELKHFASFAVGFSFISVTTGIFTTYGAMLGWSGPLGIWTWPLVILGQLLVALVYAALASRIPIAGYSYQWISRLANPKVGWFLGWLSFMFLTIVVVSVDYALASVVLPALLGYEATANAIWLVTGLVILVQALLIMFSTHLSTLINNTAVATEVIEIAGLTLLLLVVGAARGLLHGGNLFSMGDVPAAGYASLSSLRHVAPLQLAFLLGAYTIVGFESAANLAEETHEPHRVVPRAMWSSVLLSGILGMVFLIALNLAAGNVSDLAKSPTPVADVVERVLGTVVGDIFLVFVAFSIFACGLVIFITGTRLVWAMARDDRFPAHQILRKVDRRTGTPLEATVFLFVLIELLLAIFAHRSDALVKLFTAATLLPCMIYLATVIIYAATKHKLPEEHGFSLGGFEGLVIGLAILWLLFELSIFRDVSFSDAWKYTVVMLAIGAVYFVYLRVRHPHTLASTEFRSARELPGDLSGRMETGE